MYLTPYQKKQLRTVIILVIGIPLTLFGLYQAVQWYTSAGTDTQPHNVVIGNTGLSSVTVTWTTESKVRGSAVLLENGTERQSFVDKRGSSRRNTHYVVFEDLEPGTSYEFQIISGSDTYSGVNDTNFSFSTPNVQAEQPTPKSAVGKVEGNWDEDVLIYVFPKDRSAYPAITTLNSSGNWLMDLSVMRKVSDKSLYEVTPSTQLVVLAVSGVDNGGVVEGQYDEIFNSNSELIETLTPAGIAYESYIPEESKLIAQESEEESNDTPYPSEDDDDTYTPPVVEEPEDNPDEEDPFERDFELRSDLTWINLVSADGSTSTSPQSYGISSVLVTNLTDVSFSVNWYSQEKETGHIMYGTNGTEFPERAQDERDGISSQGQYYLHSVEVTQLQPETTYYFEIYSGDEKYEEVYEVTTFSTESSPPEFETISGTVNAENTESVLVVAEFKDTDNIGSSGESYPISTLVDSQGSWILTIGGARDEDGGYYEKSSSDVVILDPKYLSQSPEVEVTVGEATSNEVSLTVQESSTTFTKVSLLSDYGILID